MNGSSDDRLEELFDRAIEVPADERSAWLDRECAADSELRRELKSLLVAHDHAEGFLGRSALEESPELAASMDSAIGMTVGQYRIVERIGDGGMGTVYLAERADDSFDRRVAVKLIRRGLNTGEIVDRFDRERRVLANLNHPNIASLLDAGALPDGSPYFVMEYIEGERLDTYCDSQRLTIQQRLKLFRTVCDAVSHAHRGLVVHRDLKPANILVTHDGTVKLLDFGVAKMLDSDASQHIEHTLTVERRLTPAYASPEQIRGEPVTTSSDIYSLGVILYELLTGSRPYRLETDSWGELEQAICELQPTRPSVVVSSPRTTTGTVSTSELSHRRGVDPSRLRHILKGDVEWVVLMALRKEPSRRYATVEQFSEDLRRIGASLPVLARPDTPAYRINRFVRRNRAGVAWAAVLLIGLVAASVVSINLAISESRARSAEAEQRQFAVDERDRAIAAEERAEQRAEELEAVAAFQADQFERIDIEQMGRRVREATIEAAELDAQLAGSTVDEIATLLTDLNEQFDRVNFANVAREALDDSIFAPGLESIEERFADQPLVRARLLDSIASAMAKIGLIEESVSVQEQALVLFREYAGNEAESTLLAISRLANANNRLGRDEESHQLYSEALATYEATLGPSSQRAIATRNALGAVAQSQSDIESAERYYTEALALAREHLGNSHDTTLIILNNIAFLMLDMARLLEAEEYFEEGLETTQEIYGPDHERTIRRVHAMGVLRQRQGRNEEAEPMLRRAFDFYRSTLGDQHPDTASTMLELSRCLYSLRRLDEAESYAQAALDMGRRMRERHHQTYRALSMLGRIAMARRDLELAASHVREELSLRIEHYGEDHPSTITARGNLAVVLSRSGKLDEAEQELRIVHAKQTEHRGADNPVTLAVLYNLANTLRDQGKFEEAAAQFREVYAGRVTHLGITHQQTESALRYLTVCLRSSERQEEAFEALEAHVLAVEQQTGKSPSDSQFAPDLALLAARTERYELALSYSTAVAKRIDLPPSAHTMVLFVPGESLVALGRFDEAEEFYLKLKRSLQDAEKPDDRQLRRLRSYLSDLYRAWHEVSGDPEHLELAERWAGEETASVSPHTEPE